MKENFEKWWYFLKYIGENFNEQLKRVKAGKDKTLFGIDGNYHPDFYKQLYQLAVVENKIEQAEQLAKEYTKKNYWDVVKGDTLPDKYDIVVADTAFHSWQHMDLQKEVDALKAKYNIPDDLLWSFAINVRLVLIRKKKNFEKCGLGFDNRIVKLYNFITSG